MFNTEKTGNTKRIALATALLLVLMTVFSFTTLAFADPGKGNGGGQGNGNGLENAPGQSESQGNNNGNGPENNNGNGPENNNGNGPENNNGNGPDNNNGNGPENNNGNGNGPDSTPPAPTGTDVKYHANFVKDALDQLVSVTLTITVKDGDGNTVETDEVTVDADAYHGNFFEGTFDGDYKSTDRALLDLVATFLWLNDETTEYILDHQSAAGNGTVNVFTRGNQEIAPPTPPTTGDGDGSTGTGTGDNTSGTGDNTSGGSTGSNDSNNGNTGTNNNTEINDDSTPLSPVPTTTIGSDPVATTEAPAAETTADEILADIEEDAVPLADAPADPDVPQTGIEDNVALLAAMLLGSLAGLLALGRRRVTA